MTLSGITSIIFCALVMGVYVRPNLTIGAQRKIEFLLRGGCKWEI